MRVEWDDALDAFTADASAPGSGADDGVGPAGPGGVCVLRTGGASVSQCTMTGRVSSLWFEEDPGDEERSLVGLVLPSGAADDLSSHRARAPFEIEIAPAASRIDVSRLAILADTDKHVALPEGGLAELLLRSEQAAVLAAVHRTHPGFVSADEVAAAHERADALARRSDGVLPTGVRFDPNPVSKLLLPLADSLEAIAGSGGPSSPAVTWLRDTAQRLANQPTTMGDAAPTRIRGNPESRRFRGRSVEPVPVAFPELFATPPLSVIVNEDEPDEGTVALRIPIAADRSISFGSLASRQIGFDTGQMEIAGAWRSFTFPMDRAARHPQNRWAIGLRNGRPVGAAPFDIVGNDAVVRIACTEAPEELVVGGHPLVRSATSRTLADLASLDRLSRAAWWRHRTRPGEAGDWFAHSAAGWFAMGRVFRAGWAWSLADRTVGRDLLAERAEGDDLDTVLAALDAVVASGDVPTAQRTSQIPVPAWVHAVDLVDYAQFARPGGG